MPWEHTPASRRRDADTYANPEYRRNRDVRKRMAGGQCEQCHHPHPRLQCDHDTPVSQGGTHAVENLRMRCTGPGTCQCHERKTASEGGGYRRRDDPEPQPRTQW